MIKYCKSESGLQRDRTSGVAVNAKIKELLAVLGFYTGSIDQTFTFDLSGTLSTFQKNVPQNRAQSSELRTVQIPWHNPMNTK